MKIEEMTACQLGRKIQQREISAVEAAQVMCRQSEAGEPMIHAYISRFEDVRKQAEAVDRKIAAGEYTSLLSGVPMAVKDNLCVAGYPTTCGSHMLDGFTPAYTAHSVQKLLDVGAVIMGKTNMDEFAMGSTSETSYYKTTVNPENQSHVPGGSSGGSCAAVAAKEAYYALGSDTGGSIRQPSAYCGVTGLKPTYGTVSRYGLIAYGSSLDQVGPIGRDVTDCAAVLEVLAGQDNKDSTSVQHQNPQFTQALVADVKGFKIGIPNEYLDSSLQPEVRDAVLEAAKVLAEAGAEVEYFSLEYTKYLIPTYYTIASAEASSNLERFDGVKYGYRSAVGEGIHELYQNSRSEGFGPEVKRRIMLGTFVLSSGYYDAYYLKALKSRRLIKEAFDRAFARYDLILGPTAPSTAPKLSESLSDPLKMYLSDIFTVAANLTGVPAISLPWGRDRQGLPVGIQLTADCFREDLMIRAAYTLEQILAAKGSKVRKEAEFNDRTI